MRRPSANGPGSNQYQSKPGAPSRQLANADLPAVISAVTEDPEAEAAAWAFHPDRDTWTAYGFDGEQARIEIAAGRSPEDAVWAMTPDGATRWTANGWTAETAAPWIRIGCRYEKVGAWLTGRFTPEEAKKWMSFGGQMASKWREEKFEPDEAQQWKSAAWHLNIRGYDALAWASAWKTAGYTCTEASEQTNSDRLLP